MKPSVERFTGFADVYDQVRPSPPEAIAELLLQLAKLQMAERVVDLGCGSGLSMMMWVGKTRSIIGVEPSPSVLPDLEVAYNQCIAKADDAKYADVRLARVKSWPKDQHLENIRRSGFFRIARESTFHKIESGNIERLVGLARSQGSVAALLKEGVSEEEIGLTELREAGERVLGDRQIPWFWSYRVRIGIK
jgi:hypothetical protein